MAAFVNCKRLIMSRRNLCTWNLPKRSTPVAKVSDSIPELGSADETNQMPCISQEEEEEEEEEESVVERISRIIRNNGEDMESVLENSGVKISSKVMEKLLHRANYSWKPIFRCFTWAGRQVGFQHTSYTYNLMINIMTKMRKFESALVLIDQMQEQGLVTTQTFAILMRRYARAGMVKDALCTFETVEKFGFKPNLELFNTLLDALSKEGKVGPATLLFEERRSELEASTVTYNILINGWCRIRRLEEAQKLFDQMVTLSIPPSVVTYSTLIDGYCKTGRIEDALKLLETMKGKGSNPNVITYNSIVDALAEAGRPQDAHLMLDEMDASGCRPNISTYNSLVKGLCKQENLSAASKVLQMMMERGCLPTVTTYNYFFRFFSNHGRVNEGMNLYMKMLSSGYVLDQLTYQLLIKMLCERGRVELALQVKKDMETRGCDPDLATCTMVIHQLCRSNKLNEAYEHFDKMVRRGISPQYVTYEMLMNSRSSIQRLGYQRKITFEQYYYDLTGSRSDDNKIRHTVVYKSCTDSPTTYVFPIFIASDYYD
ncbi:hypothetical protein SUGI_0578720 [Cryptomeria japonica]|nr:hypothetical protein SUGI_0578720 [Cryptomeria japonica]